MDKTTNSERKIGKRRKEKEKERERIIRKETKKKIFIKI